MVAGVANMVIGVVYLWGYIYIIGFKKINHDCRCCYMVEEFQILVIFGCRKMKYIIVILQHSVKCNENRLYIYFEVCGLLITNDYNYNNFVTMTYKEHKLISLNLVVQDCN